jgi:hypothetical protein
MDLEWCAVPSWPRDLSVQVIGDGEESTGPHFGRSVASSSVIALTNTALEGLTGSFERMLWVPSITKSLYREAEEVAEGILMSDKSLVPYQQCSTRRSVRPPMLQRRSIVDTAICTKP